MENIRLRKLDLSDVPFFIKWWNDDEIRQWTSDTYEKIDIDDIRKIITKHLENKNGYDFIIEYNGKPIGHILIEQKKLGKFSFYIAIGEKEFWEQGIGTKATRLACDWFKTNYPGEILKLEVNQDNLRAIRCYEKVGFVKVGKKQYKNTKPTFVMEIN